MPCWPRHRMGRRSRPGQHLHHIRVPGCAPTSRKRLTEKSKRTDLQGTSVFLSFFFKRMPCLLTSLRGFYDSRNFPGGNDLTLICCMIYVCRNVRDVGIYLCVKPRQPSLQGAKSQLLILRRGGILNTVAVETT